METQTAIVNVGSCRTLADGQHFTATEAIETLQTTLRKQDIPFIISLGRVERSVWRGVEETTYVIALELQEHRGNHNERTRRDSRIKRAIVEACSILSQESIAIQWTTGDKANGSLIWNEKVTPDLTFDPAFFHGV